MSEIEKWHLLSIVAAIFIPFLIIYFLLLVNKMPKIIKLIGIFIIAAFLGIFIKAFMHVYHLHLFKTMNMQIGDILENSLYYICIFSVISLIIVLITSFKSSYGKEHSVKHMEACIIIICLLLYLSVPVFICNSKILSKVLPNTKFDIEYVLINKEFIPQLKGRMASESADDIRKNIISYYEKKDKTYLEILPKAVDLHEIAANYYDYEVEYLNLIEMFYKIGKYDDALSALNFIKTKNISCPKMTELEQKIKSKKETMQNITLSPYVKIIDNTAD